jgi:hypothetical protein
VIDLKREMERELGLIDPPDLWDRIRADASDDGDAAVVDLTTARHRRRPSLWLAVAAVMVLVALVGALALLADGQTVDTTPVTEVPVVPEPSSTTTTVAVHNGPITLAHGADIELLGGPGSGLGDQTLNIDVKAEDGEVTGEFRVSDNVIRVDCVDTLYTEGFASLYEDRVIILGGEVTEGPDFAVAGEDVLLALIIREGDDDEPDSVSLYSNEIRAESCTELLESISDDLIEDDNNFVDVWDGYDIETG